MNKLLSWIKMNMGARCPKCNKRSVWQDREESLKIATFNVYRCCNCKSEYV